MTSCFREGRYLLGVHFLSAASGPGAWMRRVSWTGAPGAGSPLGLVSGHRWFHAAQTDQGRLRALGPIQHPSSPGCPGMLWPWNHLKTNKPLNTPLNSVPTQLGMETSGLVNQEAAMKAKIHPSSAPAKKLNTEVAFSPKRSPSTPSPRSQPGTKPAA